MNNNNQAAAKGAQGDILEEAPQTSKLLSVQEDLTDTTTTITCSYSRHWNSSTWTLKRSTRHFS